jgi:hypothetical protein
VRFSEWGNAAPRALHSCSIRQRATAGSLKKKSKIVSSIHGDQIFTVRHLSIREEGMIRFSHPPCFGFRLVMSGGDAKSVPGRAKRIAAAVHEPPPPSSSPLSEAKHFFSHIHTQIV